MTDATRVYPECIALVFDFDRTLATSPRKRIALRRRARGEQRTVTNRSCPAPP